MKVENLEDLYELSPMQQGLLFHTLYAPGSGEYFIHVRRKLQGNLNVSAFERAWQRVVDRHTTLRTSFFWEELDKPLQAVHRRVRPPLEQHDWRRLSPLEQHARIDTLLHADRARGFDLTKAPLMRLTLIRVAEDTYQFVWSFHHLLLDGWSLPLVLKEVFAFYEAFRLGEELHMEPSRPYRDYIAWLQQQDVAAAEAFWRHTLKGFTEPTPLVVGRETGGFSIAERGYAEQQLQLSVATTTALQRFARQHQLTLNTLVQGAWAVLLSRYSGEAEVVFGATLAGRPAELGGVEAMVGLFINTLPVRVEVPAEARLLPWLKKVQEQQVELRQYEYSSLVDVQGWSEVARGTPLFDSLLIFENYPVGDPLQGSGGSLEVHPVRSTERTNYPFAVVALPGSELVLCVSYDCRRFDASTIKRVLGHLQSLLEGFVADPEQRLSKLPLLTQAERQQLLLEWNNTRTAYPRDKSIHELFEKQVERTPTTVAVVFEDEELTYGELNQRANQLAHYLRELGVEPEVRVGICMERSIEMVVGLLGILKAGGAYVPLDPDYPEERLGFMVEDAQVPVLLTQQHLVKNLPDHRAQVVCVDGEWQKKIAARPVEKIASEVTPENLAYVIYTSGSTGRPKGAMNTHGGICNRLLWMQQTYQLTKTDRVLQKTPFSFDVSVWEFFWPLLSGARLVVARPGGHRDSAYLIKLIDEQQITTLHFVPSMLHVFLEEEGVETCRSLRQVMCSGEALSFELQERFFARLDAKLHNLYGPTEAAVDVTYWECRGESEQRIVPIGRPIANTEVYLLDRHMNPVPIGVPGELHIGGVAVGRGYLNRPQLTSEKFIANPFSNEAGERLYKTGDLARYLPDGNIEYLGRLDEQVKIRGFRIELGEIEAVLSQHRGVHETVVIAREDAPGEKRLVAYIIAEEGAPTIDELRNYLKERLPEYMVPSVFAVLGEIPLTPNGKVDRRALPAPDAARPELEQKYVAPHTAVEEVVASIWAGVLSVEQVGIKDDFFALGGHSLLATQVMSRVREALQIEMPLRSLFEAPTVAGLAERIERARPVDNESLQPPPMLPASRNGNLPLSFAQERLWFVDQLAPGSRAFNVPTALCLGGRLNLPVLEQSLSEILRRHEALRTTFATVGGQPVQVIAPAQPLILSVVNLIDLPESEREAQALDLVIEEAQRPFDLTKGPLLRTALLRLSDEEHILFINMHHIVSDAWSAGVLFGELAVLYEAFSAGSSSPLEELPIQYADFALWQRQWLRDTALEEQLAYWKRQLAGAPAVLNLPTDRPRPAVQSFRGAKHSVVLPESLSKALKTLSRQEGATPFMVLLSAFQVLLHRYTGQEDIVVGTDIANRNRVEIERLIGFFINNVVMRTDLSGNPTFLELLGRVREVALGAYAHQDLPFNKLVEVLKPERNRSHTPLFQVLFVLQNAPVQPLGLPGLTLSPLEFDSGTSKFDLALFVEETEQGLAGVWAYKTDLFDHATIKRMASHFATLLESIVAQPGARLNALEMLTITERGQQKMEEREEEESQIKKLKSIKRKTLDLSQVSSISTGYLSPGGTFPLMVQPNMDDVDLVGWAKNNRGVIETELSTHGAILFRGFNLNSAAEFEQVALSICSELFGEYGDLPRQGMGGKVYGSTPYPADQAILFHNESSHMHRWPMKIWFYCVKAAEQGGETPIVDCRKVYELLDSKIRELLVQKKLMYVRNYTDGLDVSWQEFFHTSDRSVVEEYCRRARIDYEWKNGSGLRTRQVCQAVAKHPRTGEMVFFNQVQLHHVSCLERVIRESLLSMFGEENLPRNVYYGDGTSIEDSVMEEIGEIYEQTALSFRWQEGDMLMLDNMLTAHSRNPYVGSRKIVVAMGEMVNKEDI